MQPRTRLSQLVRFMSLLPRPLVAFRSPSPCGVVTDRCLLADTAVPETTSTEVNGTSPAPAAEDEAEQSPEGTPRTYEYERVVLESATAAPLVMPSCR